MEINGNPAVSGTLVLAAGEAGAIDVPGAQLRVRFANDQNGSRVEMDPSTAGIVFYNFDEVAIGGFMSPSYSGPSGTLHCRFFVQSVGTPMAGRVLHYSITS